MFQSNTKENGMTNKQGKYVAHVGDEKTVHRGGNKNENKKVRTGTVEDFHPDCWWLYLQGVVYFD